MVVGKSCYITFENDKKKKKNKNAPKVRLPKTLPLHILPYLP
jgi:hypothetical protein